MLIAKVSEINRYNLGNEYCEYLEKFKVGLVPEQDLVLELGSHSKDYCPLFYKGNLSALFVKPRVAVVGTRQPTEMGIARTRKLARELSRLNLTVVSGMAKGIDTIAHNTALESNATTVAVLGTPVHRPYPAANKDLYTRIVHHGVVVSPSKPNELTGKYLFPRRNRLMALICDATIIVEAGETSGVIHQAAECLRQNKRLYILKSLANNERIKWVDGFIKNGAIVLNEIDQLLDLAPK
jgi:DNA processing protein